MGRDQLREASGEGFGQGWVPRGHGRRGQLRRGFRGAQILLETPLRVGERALLRAETENKAVVICMQFTPVSAHLKHL